MRNAPGTATAAIGFDVPHREEASASTLPR